jgi:hypothetical protein
VALKRQQAAEDAIALGLRAMTTGQQFGYLPPGPVFVGVSDDRSDQRDEPSSHKAKKIPKPPKEIPGRQRSLFMLQVMVYANR